MQKIVNIHEAKTHFSEIVNSVIEGCEILIAKAGKPVAKIVPLKEKIKFGILKGKITIAEDFDASLSEEITK